MVRIPVILDTDIGGDIDDTWALSMMLNCPELDVKMVTTVSHDTIYKAKIVAKMLGLAGRSDIPVAVGPVTSSLIGAQRSWVQDYELCEYAGAVYDDAIGAIIDFVEKSFEQVTIICIGTMTNMAELLDRRPDLVNKIRIVAMCGSIYKNIQGEYDPIPESNIICDIESAKKVFEADWDIEIAPVDVCATARLFGDRYSAVRNFSSPLTKAIMQQYANWTQCHPELGGNPHEFSSILWDTVAIHMAYSSDFLEIEELGIRIDDQGYMRIDDDAKRIKCAVRWKDLDGFKDLLVSRLTCMRADMCEREMEVVKK